MRRGRVLASLVAHGAAGILLQTPDRALAVYGAVRLRRTDDAAADAGFFYAPSRHSAPAPPPPLDLGPDDATVTTTTTSGGGPDVVYGKLTLRRAGPSTLLAVYPLNLPPPGPGNRSHSNNDTGGGDGGFAIDADGRFVHGAQNPRGLWDACGTPGDYRLAVGGREEWAGGELDGCIRNISLIALR